MSSPQYPSQNPYGQQPQPYGQQQPQYGAPQGGPGQQYPPPQGQQPYAYGQAQPAGFGQQPGYAPPAGNPYGAQYGPQGGVVQKPTGWFVVNWLFFWPLAIYSLVSAWGNIDRALFAGDIPGAQYQADRVKKFGIIGLCIGIGWITLWIIIATVVVSSTTCDAYGYCS